MVQRRRSTLSFRPKSAAHPGHDTSIPRPPKRTQSQVFGPHDAEAEASAWRHSHHTDTDKEVRPLHDGRQCQQSHRRQSTLHNIELAFSTVRDLLHRRGQSQLAPAPAIGPVRARQAAIDMRPSRDPLGARAESLACPSPLLASPPAAPAAASKCHVPKRWASARQSFKRFRRPAVSGPSNDRWNPLPPPSLGPAYMRSCTGHAAADAVSQLNATNLDHHSLERSKDLPCGSMSETDSVIGDDQGRLVPQPRRIDFTNRLPPEICAIIFSSLDASFLTRCELVSKQWRGHVRSLHIWRAAFLRQYGQMPYVQPPPLQMGGVGIGNGRTMQDWMLMYQARKTIDRRWSSSTPDAIYFNGHTDSVYCCQFDEDKIVTGSRDRTIRVWDLNTYECRMVIGGPGALPQPNTPPRLDVNRSYTVSNIPSVNGTPEGRAIYYQPPMYHEASILCLQFDDEILVTGSSDTYCIVWDVKTWKPKWRLRGHDAGVLDVCFDCRYIVSCSKDKLICLWDRHTGELLKRLSGHGGPVNAVQMRGDLLVSASGDGAAMLWNVTTRSLIKELRSGDRGLAAVEFSHDARYVLAGGNDRVIYKFDVATGNVVNKYVGHDGLVRSLFLDTPNNRVISGSYDQCISVYDYDTGCAISNYRDWTTSWILSAKCDYRRIVATSQDGRILLLDFGRGVNHVDVLAAARR